MSKAHVWELGKGRTNNPAMGPRSPGWRTTLARRSAISAAATAVIRSRNNLHWRWRDGCGRLLRHPGRRELRVQTLRQLEGYATTLLVDDQPQRGVLIKYRTQRHVRIS